MRVREQRCLGLRNAGIEVDLFACALNDTVDRVDAIGRSNDRRRTSLEREYTASASVLFLNASAHVTWLRLCTRLSRS